MLVDGRKNLELRIADADVELDDLLRVVSDEVQVQLLFSNAIPYCEGEPRVGVGEVDPRPLKRR